MRKGVTAVAALFTVSLAHAQTDKGGVVAAIVTWIKTGKVERVVGE